MVPAGAVAADIEAIIIENTKDLPSKKYMTEKTTNKTPTTSQTVITKTSLPSFLRSSNLNSLPIEKAITPKANSFTKSTIGWLASFKTLKNEGPKNSPATM